jgi:hypothetical protein
LHERVISRVRSNSLNHHFTKQTRTIAKAVLDRYYLYAKIQADSTLPSPTPVSTLSSKTIQLVGSQINMRSYQVVKSIRFVHPIIQSIFTRIPILIIHWFRFVQIYVNYHLSNTLLSNLYYPPHTNVFISDYNGNIYNWNATSNYDYFDLESCIVSKLGYKHTT